MSRSTKDTERKRMSLFRRQDGRCYWCACDLVVSPPGKHIKSPPPNLATIEHLRDRFDPTRWERNRNGERRLVLACLECNNRRGAENQAAAGKEELRRRSGYYKNRLFKVDRLIGTPMHDELQSAHEGASL